MTLPTGNACLFKSHGGLHDASDSSLLLRAVRYCGRRVYTAFTFDDEVIAARCLTDTDPCPADLYVITQSCADV